jgi:hypothetical protein
VTTEHFSSRAPDAAQHEFCEPEPTLTLHGVVFAFFVLAPSCSAEGTLRRVRDTRALVPHA